MYLYEDERSEKLENYYNLTDGHHLHEVRALISKDDMVGYYGFTLGDPRGYLLCTNATYDAFFSMETSDIDDKEPFYKLFLNEAMSHGFEESVIPNGAVEVLDGEHKYGKGKMLSMKTGLGDLVVYSCGDPGIYDEFSIDLIAPDGHCLQVACVGVAEENKDDPDLHVYAELHVYALDGSEESVVGETILDVEEDSYWYEK